MFWSEKKKKPSKHFTLLSKKLEEKKNEALEGFKEKHREISRWAKKKGLKTEEVVGKSAKGLAVGVATAAVALSSGTTPGTRLPDKNLENQKEIRRDIAGTVEPTVKAKADVTSQVKNDLTGANYYDEKKITQELTRILNIPVKADLNGIRLNATYGIMGSESHLSRYPGDNLATHFESDIDHARYAQAGMAGGPGAWGYLAPSQQKLTAKDTEMEKYYLVAQTFLSPNWGTPAVKAWFRHRKMIVINPRNGVVVAGVLEDAGPEAWTGRKFGGSPEVINELELSKTGPHVLMYFVDDPQDQIPLGRYGR